MQAIAINQTPINHANGLYCLNDLHRAAGGEKRHQPSNWLHTEQAKELIAELNTSQIWEAKENQQVASTPEITGVKQNQQVIKVVNGGDGRGTYVCRELVYAYAMWISPRFHLAVIRAFDALQAAGQAPQAALPNFADPAAAARAWAQQYEQLQHQQARLVVAEPKAAALDLLSERGNARSLTLAAKELKTSRTDLIAFLKGKKWIYGKKPICAAAKAIDAGDMVQVAGISERNGASYTQALITAKGLAKLAEHFAERQS